MNTTQTTTKLVYDFGEGNASMKSILGGKGANLAEMTKLGIPVPFGFTITTETCDLFYKNDRQFPEFLEGQIAEKLAHVEKRMGKKLGDPTNPLLVSVRSGAAISMPGMMDTILNLGLNERVIEGLISKTNNERFVRDSYRRFIQMFGSVVLNVSGYKFERILDDLKESRKIEYDTDLTPADLELLASAFKELIKAETETEFPEDPHQQLHMAIQAVFESWNNERAILYRKLNDIKGLLGTAVNVQAMVYGNMGECSGTGVCFTRDPATGENVFYGEYLMNAQGEDVVAGIRTPQTLDRLKHVNEQAYSELCTVRNTLEKHYRDMQDMEFTIQEGKLFMLQTRTGKRTAAAAIKIAVDMCEAGLITKKEAVLRVDPASLDQLLHEQIDQSAKADTTMLTRGLPASPGAAVGQVVFDAHRAHEWAENGLNVILVRTETSPEDLIGMNAAQGILTARGGMTSHAAVVARGMGKCCIAGAGEVRINEELGYFSVNGTRINEGDFVTLDGSFGELFEGKLATVKPKLTGNFAKLMSWADEFRTLHVRTNADVPHDAETAITFGAEGIGLCRTEHMFFEGERIMAMREMILASSESGRKAALAKLLPYQREDFKGIYKAMGRRPVTVRLLDPPLHEFLPKDENDIETLAKTMGVTSAHLHQKIESLHEQNPMLGHRGCRLGISYPEITEMQTRAIIEAALAMDDDEMVPEIMIPLVGNIEEFKNQQKIVRRLADEIIRSAGRKMKYMVGTMIEVPRAALTADEIGAAADFFSFGTNDLTQMTLGYSRDDVGTFVPEYIAQGILEKDPFQVLDQTGVGQLVQMAVEKGRSANPNLELGICGEHGGEPTSVEFCHHVGLHYVSCSPYRVPIARLAAAHAALKEA